MATYQDFEDIMDRNYGTQHFYAGLFGDKFVYTDGVKEFAEKFECYWLIDMVESYIPKVSKFVEKNLYKTKLMDSCTMNVLLKVKDSKALFNIIAFGYDEETEEEIETIVAEQEIVFTDMPDGNYKLFLGAEGRFTLLLTSEY